MKYRLIDSIGLALFGWLVLFSAFVVPEYAEMGMISEAASRLIRSLSFGLFAGYLGATASGFFDDVKKIRLTLEDR